MTKQSPFPQDPISIKLMTMTDIANVSPKKQQDLANLLKKLNINTSDIQRTYITGQGKGGQKQNSTKNCIQLKHIPTNTIITCQASRSRLVNEYKAMIQLTEHIAQLKGIPTKTSIKQDKLKKQKQRRKRRSTQTKQDLS